MYIYDLTEGIVNWACLDNIDNTKVTKAFTMWSWKERRVLFYSSSSILSVLFYLRSKLQFVNFYYKRMSINRIILNVSRLERITSKLLVPLVVASRLIDRTLQLVLRSFSVCIPYHYYFPQHIEPLMPVHGYFAWTYSVCTRLSNQVCARCVIRDCI